MSLIGLQTAPMSGFKSEEDLIHKLMWFMAFDVESTKRRHSRIIASLVSFSPDHIESPLQ